MNKAAFTDINNSNAFNDLNEHEKITLVSWITDNLEQYRIKSYQNHHSSYGLKHVFERSEQGFYITNGQFKGAMLHAGFKPKNTDDINWTYQLSKKTLQL